MERTIQINEIHSENRIDQRVAKKAERLNPTNATMEPYEDLKTSLITRFPEGSARLIMLTGTTGQNGVSTTVANLAITLARDSEKGTLLIDANLRGPGLQGLFKVSPGLGLSDLLTTSMENIKPTPVAFGNLHVLSAGKRPTDPLTLFESTPFNDYLNYAKEHYNYIVLDSAPIHTAPESLVLASRVDGVVLVLESGKTRQQVAVRAKKQLEAAGAKILGVVLNRRKYYIPEFIYQKL